MEDPELAEAAQFVLESAAGDDGQGNQEAADGGIPGAGEENKELTEQSSQDGAQHVAPLLEAGPNGNGEVAAAEVVAEPEFLKGRRRKKGADKPGVGTTPG